MDFFLLDAVANAGGAVGAGGHGFRRQDFVDALVVVKSEGDLLEIVGTLHAASGLAGGLHGGQQQSD